MARPTHVPQFGKWDANDHVPYTAVFDSARAGKGGKLINPNDPYENPEAFTGGAIREVLKEDPLPPQPYTEKSKYSSQPVLKNGSQRNGAESITAHRIPSEGRYTGQPGGPVRADAPPRNRLGSGHGSGESQDADRSPSHAQAYQGRLGKKLGSASPAWERRASTESLSALATATPGRSRIGTKADETPDRTPALPKFGAWDEKDPSSAEGFTVIFNQARNEKKQGGPARIPGLQTESPARFDYQDINKRQSMTFQQKQPSCWSCCFSSSAKE